jgi:hypothetical protein
MSNERFDLDDLMNEGAGTPAKPAVQTKITPVSDKLIIVGMLLDNSGSISNAGLEGMIRDGSNTAIEGLRGIKGADVALDIRTFTGQLYSGMLKNVPENVMSHYHAGNNSTPICACAIELIKSLRQQQAEQKAAGISTTIAMVLPTDGQPMNDTATPDQFAKLIQEGDFIVGLGVTQQESEVAEYHSLFRSMGASKILTSKATPQEFRRSMGQFSRSVAKIAG